MPGYSQSHYKGKVAQEYYNRREMASQSQSETNSVIQSQRVRFIDLQEALRSGMAVQMVKTKPRGWVGDARRRHHSPTDDHAPSSVYGSTNDWVQEQTRYRVNNPHGGKGGRPIQHQPIVRSHGPHPGNMAPRGPYPPRPMGPPRGPNHYPPNQTFAPHNQAMGPRINRKSELAAYYKPQKYR